jgi:integrase/recombinase XerD
MVKLKTVLDLRRAKADGTYSILFRITNHKEVKYIPFGLSVFETHWDSKTLLLSKYHPNVSAVNAAISKKYYEIQKAIIKLEDDGHYSFEELKRALVPQVSIGVKVITFKEYSQQIIADMMKVKRTGNALVYLTAVNRFMEFCDNPKIEFKDITYTVLDAFKSKLLQDGLKLNSIGNYFRSIRALYNKAIKAKVVAREHYPFNDIIIKTEKTAKRAISTNELSSIYLYPRFSDSQQWNAANYFFLSFALRGISFTDMAYLKQDNVHNGYLTYRRRKTKKLYNIKLHPTAIKILTYYKKHDTEYLLPIFPSGIIEDGEVAKKITRQWIKTTNKYLNRIALSAGVNCNVTTYVIRHCWGTIAKRLGYSNEMIAEGLGHEYGNKITNIYLDEFEQSLIDSMNDNVILQIIPCLLTIARQKTRLTFPVSTGNFRGQKLLLAT